MEKAIEIKNLYFKYPNGKKNSLENINFSADCGELIVIAGSSGCGKSTLLRQMKKSLSPHGERQGEILIFGEGTENLTAIDDAKKIAMVMQDAENQIVTDKVYHELAFGLESLGAKNEKIRRRVAEVSAFFGIEDWFYRTVTELSGGQKQILNLASAVVTEPEILLLDEPTSQLDPIAAEEFLSVLRRINKELGITVIIAEHRLESLIGICDRLCLMENGKIGFFGDIKNCEEYLREHENLLLSMPSAMRIWFGADGGGKCPLNTAEGRKWLAAECERRTIREPIRRRFEGEPILEMKSVYFRYEKDLPDVLSDFSFTVNRGELLAVMGGNGEGKSTAARLMRGIGKPYMGTVKINGEKIKKENR